MVQLFLYGLPVFSKSHYLLLRTQIDVDIAVIMASQKRDIHTNVMLDLGTAAGDAPNPCILEIGAIHFDINTGEELDHFSTIINYVSCLSAGLVSDQSTREWITQHIPETFDAARRSSTTLTKALTDFAEWLERCHAVNVRTQEDRGLRWYREIDSP